MVHIFDEFQYKYEIEEGVGQVVFRSAMAQWNLGSITLELFIFNQSRRCANLIALLVVNLILTKQLTTLLIY